MTIAKGRWRLLGCAGRSPGTPDGKIVVPSPSSWPRVERTGPRMAKERRLSDPWADAVAHLKAVDPRWGPVIDRVGPCRLRPRRDRFGTLVRAIISQQISTRAAASIEARLRDLGGAPHDPQRLLELGETALRGVGLSGVKARYLLNLSEAVASDALPLRRIGTGDDERVIAQLTAVK